MSLHNLREKLYLTHIYIILRIDYSALSIRPSLIYYGFTKYLPFLSECKKDMNSDKS